MTDLTDTPPPTFTDDGTRITLVWPERGPVTVAPDVIEGWAEQVNQLRAEITKLRAGATDDPGDEAAIPTPGQWIARFLAADADQRVRVVEHVQRQAEEAGDCFILDHGGRLDDYRDRTQRLNALLREVLSGHVWHENGHPGRPCVRTGWVDDEKLHDWRARARTLEGPAGS